MTFTPRRPTGSRLSALAAIAAIALAVPACGSPLLSLGSSLADAAFSSPSAERGQLVAEVVEVDELQRRIRVTTDDGRTGSVIYDQNTVVVRDDRNHTVRTIRPGEVLLIQVERNGGGLYATRVDVQPPEPEPAPAPEPIVPTVEFPDPDPTPDPAPDTTEVDPRAPTGARPGSA